MRTQVEKHRAKETKDQYLQYKAPKPDLLQCRPETFRKEEVLCSVRVLDKQRPDQVSLDKQIQFRRFHKVRQFCKITKIGYIDHNQIEINILSSKYNYF